MDKAVYVREMFATIAPRYDATNRLLTAGLDERWRRRAVRELAAPPGGRIVDLCCGTGDLSFHLARTDPSLRIDGIDFCEPMLAGARRRAAHEAHGERIAFSVGDVTALPYSDASFDGAIMGFSMRNVVDLDATLREVRRVLKEGARFVNLDVSKAPNPFLRRAFNLYFYGMVPLIGGLVGGSKSAYRYLPNSLTNFPGAEGLQEHFTRAGFRNTCFMRLAGGTVAIHVGAR
ncbi:MAG TPA: bifunctional demethylmenaquinone methyltransferase/2-methoxy-6-polyprenyl-1,4-benzoquinol methylase UbiE [Candidatus Baltobacteraceae bacterium]|jgi:demethylmenaquinone methyltransferase/2-methoxy-6-polyprenyl-1,4-benzoquinol methylase|nr:bifunctional demethylmenaquinone methyltransferase/2-methoxy-6-polyprenyl-1,4-benzoquinol methylase UbiE [Candidatus Baltobacteraceae bacterium]